MVMARLKVSQGVECRALMGRKCDRTPANCASHQCVPDAGHLFHSQKARGPDHEILFNSLNTCHCRGGILVVLMLEHCVQT